MSSDGVWEKSIKYVVWNIIIHLGVIYSVYDNWKKFLRENLAEVFSTFEVANVYFNDSRFVEKFRGI